MQSTFVDGTNTTTTRPHGHLLSLCVLSKSQVCIKVLIVSKSFIKHCDYQQPRYRAHCFRNCQYCYDYIRLTAFSAQTTWVSRHQKGKPFRILMKQETMGWQWHQVDHMQIICTSLQTDNHTSTSPLSLYRPDALAATQPTASKCWRQ